ncbi:MAG: DUF3341 domain-containing protein [Bdellovibrionales bacterium]|nr:DUF3341 domain-containing protein [Bdellovibrionales bacterium]
MLRRQAVMVMERAMAMGIDFEGKAEKIMSNEQNAGATDRKLAGVLGFFDNPQSLIEGMKRVREANYEVFDAFTPYPVHGLDAAQGLKRSPLPYVTFIFGATGFMLALALQYWTSAVDWPLNVGGKPFFSWPAFVPVIFELTVLLAGLSTVAGMFVLNGLPNVTQRAFDPSLTNNRFAILIGAPKKKKEEDDEDQEAKPVAYAFKLFSESEAAEFLKKAGANEVRTVYQEGWF